VREVFFFLVNNRKARLACGAWHSFTWNA
jgi:hypothetical protein